MFFLLKEPDIHTALVKEVRAAFLDYYAVNIDSAGNLKYLHACVQESLRLHQDTVDSLPRVSPGAVVEGTYIPPGVNSSLPLRTTLRGVIFTC
jgi:cytochrome P450